MLDYNRLDTNVAKLFENLLPSHLYIRSCYSHARVFRKTLVHEFHFFYSYTEWCLFFLDRATTSAHAERIKKSKYFSTSKPVFPGIPQLSAI